MTGVPGAFTLNVVCMTTDALPSIKKRSAQRALENGA